MVEKNWRHDVESDARDAVEYFMDEIVDGLYDNGRADTGITDYSDSYHHENHVDQSYSLLEAAKLLEDLRDHEEEDSGLWEGQDPREAISTMAAFTYGNAVASDFQDFVENINDDAGSIHEDMEAERNAEIEDWEEKLEEEDISPARKAEIERRLEQLSDEEVFELRVKKRIRKVAEQAAGIRKQTPIGPKEWEPD